MRSSLHRTTSASLLGLLSALLPLGCMSAAIDRAADAQVAEVRAQTESTVVYTSCPDSRPLGPNCGLIMRRLAHEEFRQRFRDAFCKAMTPQECQSRYERMIDARLEQRYYAADQAAVTRTCDANPGRCDDPIAYEMLLLDSHNARVVQDGARAELRIERGRRNAHARDVQRSLGLATAVTGDIAYGLHDGPKCRTYPSVLGGANTVCSDGRK